MGNGSPVKWSVGAVTNLRRNDVTTAIPLKFDPETHRSVDSPDDDGRHCLSGINAKDCGARAQLGFILLRPPQTIARALVSI